jgi:methionyl aminopeptidase
VPFKAIGDYIQPLGEAAGYSVVKEFCGHGIGRLFHMPPLIFHISQYTCMEMSAKGVTRACVTVVNACIISHFRLPPSLVAIARASTENASEDVMQPGMTFTIEPMFNEGESGIEMLNDNWTYVTKSVRVAAQCVSTSHWR